MKTTTKHLSWVLYATGMCLLLLGTFTSLDCRFSLITAGATITFFPWVICIVSIFNMEGDRMLWTAAMFSIGMLAIPAFLLKKEYQRIP